MKRNLLKTLASTAPALLLLAAVLGMAGCTADDDFGRLPQGSIPLTVGEVTVAGMKTNTRAEENPIAAYTGIRKSHFVKGDVLTLTLSNDGGTTNTTVTAILTGGAWVLSDKAYVIPGTTGITASFTATEQTAGIKPDALAATTYTLDGQKVTFAMKHTNAMIDITTGTLPAGVTIGGITLLANNGTADETLATVAETDRGDMTDTKHYRTIALPGTVKSITAVINGQSYVATLATPLTVEANKKYPISLTFKENTLTATVGTASINWGAGGTIDGVPAGYDRVIRTPEDLAQFAKDVNDDATTTGACLLKVLQTADIDLSKLKAADAAGINPLTGMAYTYTARADAWVPIGGMDAGFQGTYNGNGYTISNLKSTDGYGLFYNVIGGTLTGIHLRSVKSQGSFGRGCLANKVTDSTISLCSATGTFQSTNTGSIGGLIGEAWGSSITRCSADVDVTTATSNSVYAGGLIGQCVGGTLAGCIVTGDVTNNSSSDNSYTGGLIGYFTNEGTGTKGNIFGCLVTGNVTTTSGEGYALLGIAESGSVNVSSCFATGSGYDFVSSQAGVTYSDCAYTGTQNDPITGITGSVAVDDIYTTVTANNASLANVKTLHWSAAEGYTLTPITRAWYATDVWKENGTAAPTLNLEYEGWNGKK